MNMKRSLSQKISRYLATTFFMVAHAEENPDDDNGNKQVNYEQLIAAARQEEKKKLYPVIEELKQKNAMLTQSLNEALLGVAKKQAEIEELSKKGDSEEVKTLKAKVEALEAENAKLKENAPDEAKIREEISKEFELRAYASTKIAEANKDGVKILSVYAKDVTGKTQEEIDEAIKKAIEESAKILKEIGGDKPPKDEKKPEEKKPDTPPANNPSVTFGGQSISLEYIQKLRPGTPEYEEFRKKVGLR